MIWVCFACPPKNNNSSDDATVPTPVLLCCEINFPNLVNRKRTFYLHSAPHFPNRDQIIRFYVNNRPHPPTTYKPMMLIIIILITDRKVIGRRKRTRYQRLFSHRRNINYSRWIHNPFVKYLPTVICILGWPVIRNANNLSQTTRTEQENPPKVFTRKLLPLFVQFETFREIIISWFCNVRSEIPLISRHFLFRHSLGLNSIPLGPYWHY